MVVNTSAALAGNGLPAHKLTHRAPFETIIKDKASQKLIIGLSLRLRRGQISGPEAVSEATAKALRSVVSSAKYNSMQELIDIIKAAGRYLQLSQPAEQSIGNITRRVVHLLREEAKAALLEAHEKEMGGTGRRSAGSGSGINNLSNSISDLHLASAFGRGGSAIPSHVTQSQSPSASGSASSSSNSVPQLPSHANRSLNSSTSHSQFPSSSSSTGAGTHSPMTRPGPYPLRASSETNPGGSSAFVHGSFSISDLVAAGAMATSTSSSLAHTPADESYVSTPHASLSRKGSGVFDSSLAQLSQQMSGVSLAEDPAGEAEAEEAMQSGKVDDEEDDSEEEDDEEDEDDEDEDEDDDEVDTSKLITGKKSAGAYFLKPLLIQAIQDLIDELETVDDNISKVSHDHIHSGEVILTLGSSATVQGFFSSAAKDRKFTVIVPETAPSYSGHTLARALAKSGISVLLIPDASIFAVLPRVSKVVLGAHAVLANGGLISAAGSYATALAAKQHSTPVMILTGVYKICPEWSSIQDFANASGSVGALGPAALLDYATSSSIVENAEVVSNAFDYVPPHLVDVFITNVGEHPPSYVYRLVKENYHQDDIVL
ncbi:related to GCD7-translation initiation factor eIF2b, 43 kDa subunit [Sporisorium scitamineum]|uniref:Translation initiation factor eIF2B subunit beta n=1 Tax=Sporisorium scitamineum TaxID=49012 RepID=A0A127ZER6_9BASI|nr:related to GCD7-translation initiation factor eIF2b, 43 kDa subunit [Sporisorium scitamineum]